MTTLTEIGREHRTDKGYSHRYWELYDLLLARHRKTARMILELGVYQGESLEVWRKGFPQAEIHGVDMFRVRTWAQLHIGNAYTETMLRTLPDQFDIIVDDGPHTLESMLYVAEHYTGRLADSGTLVIEDIQDRQWIPRIVDRLPEELRASTFVIDRTTVPDAPTDSILFVVDKCN